MTIKSSEQWKVINDSNIYRATNGGAIINVYLAYSILARLRELDSSRRDSGTEEMVSLLRTPLCVGVTVTRQQPFSAIIEILHYKNILHDLN